MAELTGRGRSVFVSLFLVAVVFSEMMMVMMSPTPVARLSAYIGLETSSCQSDCAGAKHGRRPDWRQKSAEEFYFS